MTHRITPHVAIAAAIVLALAGAAGSAVALTGGVAGPPPPPAASGPARAPTPGAGTMLPSAPAPAGRPAQLGASPDAPGTPPAQTGLKAGPGRVNPAPSQAAVPTASAMPANHVWTPAPLPPGWVSRVNGELVAPAAGMPFFANAPSPLDPLAVVCTPRNLDLWHSTSAAAACSVTSQNGFAGTISIACNYITVGWLPVKDPGCTTPGSIDVPLGGSVEVPVKEVSTEDVVQYASVTYLAISFNGAILEAPNWMLVEYPPPPPPAFTLNCQIQSRTMVDGGNGGSQPAAVASCTLVSLSSRGAAPTQMTVGLEEPSGAWNNYAACIGLTEREVTPVGGGGGPSRCSPGAWSTITPSPGGTQFWFSLVVPNGPSSAGTWRLRTNAMQLQGGSLAADVTFTVVHTGGTLSFGP